LESELFGYRKGAFTDARKDKPGRFALADRGTLFLDEISDISTALQVKLLRVLQEREYEPLGATATVKSDVRLIAATNQPLSAQVARGVFREDLYYRLNVVRIVLPSLAERREDIPLLAHHFIEQLNAKQGKRIEGMSEEALARLMRYKFPGNVRELQNILEHAVVLCRTNRIEVGCLPAELLDDSSAGAASKQDLAGAPLMDAEAGAILETLRRNDGHRGRTAMALGIDKSTLWRKMKRYGITYP
jgi:transcriptional regulator with PAS, ATPase and Fis domain